MADEQKPGDPADRVADGAFGGVHSHRAGYGGRVLDGRVYTREEWIERSARQGGTLAAGEGKVLVEELDRLRAAVVEGMTKVARAERIVTALREPSEAVLMAAKRGMEESWPLRQVAIPADWYARALEDAVAAAEEAVNQNPHRPLDKEEG